MAIMRKRFNRLLNMIVLAEYQARMYRYVNMSHAKSSDGLIELDMGYTDEPWAHDPRQSSAWRRRTFHALWHLGQAGLPYRLTCVGANPRGIM
jgi:hypothetical protein